MPIRLTVPHLDANILDVTVTAWRKNVGDRVSQGEIVADLTTDKATFEYESTGSGTLLAVFAAPKSVVPSGYILAILGEPGETDADAAAFNAKVMEKYRAEVGGQKPVAAAAGRGSVDAHVAGAPPRGAISSPPPSTTHPPSPAVHPPPSTATAPAARVRATPRARRLAQEQNLDLAAIQAATGAEVVDEAVLQKFLSQR
jgi:pyruvate dehydrogenase E2 component (dihydrolipoamide acetyltransferase)